MSIVVKEENKNIIINRFGYKGFVILWLEQETDQNENILIGLNECECLEDVFKLISETSDEPLDEILERIIENNK